MAERSNALVLKTGSPQGLVGSNPTPSAIESMPEEDAPTPTKPRKLSISRKVILGVAFTLFMLALIALTSFISTRRFLAVSAKVAETREILERIERVQRYFMEMESGVRGFMLSGEDRHLVPYEHGQSFIIHELQDLRKATFDREEQQTRVERLQSSLSRAFAVHGQSIDRRREGGVTAAAAHFLDPANQRESEQVFGMIRDELSDFDQAERVRLRDDTEQLDAIGRVNTSLVAGGTSLTYIALLVACLFVLRDIAERRRAEDALEMERNLLRSIMDTIPDFIIVKDLEGRYLRINEAYCRHLGLGKPEDARGKTAFDFYPKELAERYTTDERAVLESGVPQADKIEPNVTRDGREVWLETTIVPLRASSGDSIGIVGLSSDITQRREDDERLRHFALALQRSNDELQNFASVASHDLQEPLRKIQAFGDRLRTRTVGLGEQERDFITRMMDAAGRMQTLIQDLLKLSRVTTRALPFEPCDLNEIVRGVLQDLEVTIAATGAKLAIAPLPTIEGDPTQLRQLLQNLIANGLKFQAPGTRPEISVTCRLFENNGELPAIARGAKLCEIRVADNGIGFDPQFAEQIFGPFKRLHSRTDYEGSGIGLSVCRKITDRHRGRIVAQSADGHGATFIITLPAGQPRATSP
jgi:two-component system, LuxR family, sensor kinase FixL